MQTNHSSLRSSTPKTAKSEKSSDGAIAFADFVLTLSVYPNPRGAFIADLKTLINAGVMPSRFYGWNDLYSFLAYHHRTSPEAIEIARKLWRQYQKSQIAVSPGSTRGANHGW